MHLFMNQKLGCLGLKISSTCWYFIHNDMLWPTRKHFSFPKTSHIPDKSRARLLKRANIPRLNDISSGGSYSGQFWSLLKKSWSLPSSARYQSLKSHLSQDWMEAVKSLPATKQQICFLKGEAQRIPRFVSKDLIFSILLPEGKMQSSGTCLQGMK